MEWKIFAEHLISYFALSGEVDRRKNLYKNLIVQRGFTCNLFAK